MTGNRFSDSEIPGSKPVIGSSGLIADYHVLRRHLTPRHSPYALRSLTIKLLAFEHSRPIVFGKRSISRDAY